MRDLARLVSDILQRPRTPLPTSLFFIGHFHKTPRAIASRRKFDYDEPACARRARPFFFLFLIKIADLSVLRGAFDGQKLNEAVPRVRRVEIIIRVTIRNW